MSPTDPAHLSLDTGTEHVGHHLGHAGRGRHLIGALMLTLSFAIVEAVAGLWSGSLALISDAGHMLTDSTALGLAALATWLARRPPSPRHTYGLVRVEILAALLNGLIMLGLIAFIAWEAFTRLQQPRPVDGGMVTLVAFIGLLVNILVAWRLSRGERDLNTRAALLHVIGDLLGSLAAIIAGVVILTTGWTPIDPLLSLLVAGLILVSAWRLIAESLHILLEATPAHLSATTIAATLDELPGVREVHDLHIWALSSGKVALSAHLDLDSVDAWPALLVEARRRLADEYGIGHVTLQPEVCARKEASP